MVGVSQQEVLHARLVRYGSPVSDIPCTDERVRYTEDARRLELEHRIGYPLEVLCVWEQRIGVGPGPGGNTRYDLKILLQWKEVPSLIPVE